MRIEFAPLTSPRQHPLSGREVRAILAQMRSRVPETIDRINSIYFGWNSRTTQEARIVMRGQKLDIRINFTIRDHKSRLLSPIRRWTAPVRACGGIPNPDERAVAWPPGTARRYAAFLLLHELAHMVYLSRPETPSTWRKRGSISEEAFCDEWALRALETVHLG